MKKDRTELNSYFEKLINRYIDDPEKKAKLQSIAEEKYGIPPFRIQVILKHEAAIEECDNIEIFWIIDCIYDLKRSIKKELDEYFTENEIKFFSQEKYEKDDIKWPIEFPVFQVADDQWIGTIDANFLSKMRKNNLLRYNKNIQRRVKTVVRGNEFYESIDLNKRAVESIKDLLKENKFIPNTITLNFDVDIAKFTIIKGNGCDILRFDRIDHLDILDGYHRFVAISRLIDELGSIDLTLEVRFACYSDDKANQFIWQEEQKTRVPQKDVKTYNMEDISNKVVKRVNESSSCNLAGKITRSGYINSGDFAEFIDRYYISNMSEEEKELAIVTVSKDIIEDINLITEDDVSRLTKKYSLADVRMLTYLFSKFYKKPKSNFIKTYSAFFSNPKIKEAPFNIYKTKKAADKLFEDVFLEVMKDV